ncbi:hypothetical protein II5_06002 [Bacillus cereus MSX-A1]|uniref:response regulator transcription factor n=1 Tax=Bacillus cereus TaxID=1396 RepID=UPI000279540C|nr:response regulator transcription factor [Bacillus cereus]EJQ97272.1 hypothetical protein II5_06002 [Bacillus cereus MSX-A1]MDR4292618.1 response regulator transcription factor [Bacillus cereus]
MYKIMIVENDRASAELLQIHINKFGYEGVITTDFERILDVFEEIEPDLILLDINLPKFDGFYWCRQIRNISTCPIIFISACSGGMAHVMALDQGADDYITKPLHYEVVMAKIRCQFRRLYGECALRIIERRIEQSGLILYPERMELRMHNITSSLTKNEAILMELLLQYYPKVVSRKRILEALWGDRKYIEENTLSVNITRIRKKLKEMGINYTVETVRSAGYRLKITWNDDKKC